MAEGRKPWDQLEGEPGEAYARFLAYRNLGPGRSLSAAAAAIQQGEGASKRVKTRRPSGQWYDDSAQFNWKERATAWDIEMLSTVGHAVIVKQIAAIEGIADALLGALSNGIRPDKWADILEGIRFLTGIISPEAADAAYRRRPWVRETGDDGPSSS